MAIKSSDIKIELKNARETIENSGVNDDLKSCLLSLFKVISIHARMDLDTRSNTTTMMKAMDLKLSTEYNDNDNNDSESDTVAKSQLDEMF